MEICNVINFERIDQYLKEHKSLNIFEESIILWLASHFRERELFFLLKDPTFPQNIALLENIYRKMIGGKYSTHQVVRLATCDKEGNFWYRFSPQFQCSAFQGDNYYRFKENVDYLTLYEDRRVKIIVFLLKLIGIFEGYDNKKYILQDGFYVNPETPHVILPYDEPYTYSYSFEEYDPSQYSELKEYYQEQREKLTQNLKRSLEYTHYVNERTK